LGRRGKGGLQYVDHLKGDGAEIFEHACRLGLEGIVSKRVDSTYRAGRSRVWVKVKNRSHPAIMRVAESFVPARAAMFRAQDRPGIGMGRGPSATL
jgi:ATP-dependent DNA ligase